MTLLAYEVDAGHSPFYWEIYTAGEMTYVDTIEAEDFGDWIAKMRKDPVVQGDVKLFPQEPYQIQQSIHIELDKFFGQPDDYLDDCDAIHNPLLPLDPFCPGCKAFKDWTVGRFAGDFFNNPRLWRKDIHGTPVDAKVLA